MDEHHWKFKVGSHGYDQYKAVRGQGFDYARVEILCGGEWDIFVGQPVAEEMLRLATEVERLKAEAAFAPDRVLEAVKLGERARIREGLVAALQEIASREVSGVDTYYVGVRDGRNAFLRSVVEALNRICDETPAREIPRLAEENEELRRCLDFHMLDAARLKSVQQMLKEDLRRKTNEYIEACHDLSVKHEERVAGLEARVKELEADAAAAVLRLAAMEEWLIDKCDQPAAPLRLTVMPRDLVAREVRRILCLSFQDGEAPESALPGAGTRDPGAPLP